MTTQALHLAWILLKLPSHPLCMTSQPLSQRHHIYCVRHQRWHMYAIKCTIQDIISTLYDNNFWYVWHYMHYIQYITCIISTLHGVTFTICGTSHNDSIYGIKPYMFMTYSFYMAPHTVLWPQTIVCLHIHYAWYYTLSIFDITLSVPILWEEVNVSHHSLYMYDIICTTYDITSTLYDITPLYLWHQVHYI